MEEYEWILYRVDVFGRRATWIGGAQLGKFDQGVRRYNGLYLFVGYNFIFTLLFKHMLFSRT